MDVYSLHSVKSMLCIEALHPLPPPRPCHLSGHTCFSHRQSSVGEDGLSIVLTTGHWCWEQTQFCLLGVTTAKFYGNWQKVGKTVRAKGDGGCRGPLPSIGVFAVTLKKGRLPGGSVGSASHLPRAIGRRVRDRSARHPLPHRPAVQLSNLEGGGSSPPTCSPSGSPSKGNGAPPRTRAFEPPAGRGDLGLRAMCVVWSAEKGAGLWWKTRSCFHCRFPWAPSRGVAATAPGPISVTPALPRDQLSAGGGKGL